MARNFYEVLGVGKNASQDEIKRAYRTLALKYHPDIAKDKASEEKFKEINESYAVLSDPEKRKQYDAYGPEGFNQRYTQQDIFRDFDFEKVFRDMGFGFGNEDINDIFGGMFSFGNRTQQRGDVGNDILARVDLTLKEAYTGADKKLRVRHVVRCERCNGNGAEPGSSVLACGRCNGSGRATSTVRTPFGVMQTVTQCPKCGGSGKTVERTCRDCNGTGRKVAEQTVTVSIPKGVGNGMQLRLAGMGDFGSRRTGDLYVETRIGRDGTFQRDGEHIHVDAHIPFYTALLGGTVAVPTLSGEHKIDIEGGMTDGTEILIRGKGMPRFKRTGYGDEIVTVRVDIPKSMTKEQRDLIKRFEELDTKKKRFGIF